MSTFPIFCAAIFVSTSTRFVFPKSLPARVAIFVNSAYGSDKIFIVRPDHEAMIGHDPSEIYVFTHDYYTAEQRRQIV